MTITIAQLASLGLTAGQQTKLTQAQTIGDACILNQQGKGPLPDISTSGLTLAQAKAVENFVRDLNALSNRIQTGTTYFREKTRDDAAATADATPAGTF